MDSWYQHQYIQIYSNRMELLLHKMISTSHSRLNHTGHLHITQHNNTGLLVAGARGDITHCLFGLCKYKTSSNSHNLPNMSLYTIALHCPKGTILLPWPGHIIHNLRCIFGDPLLFHTFAHVTQYVIFFLSVMVPPSVTASTRVNLILSGEGMEGSLEGTKQKGSLFTSLFVSSASILNGIQYPFLLFALFALTCLISEGTTRHPEILISPPLHQ